MFREAIIAAILIWPWAIATASAQDDCQTETYDHNGSAMDVTVCRADVTIRYRVPRRGLARHGVVPGTVLFAGRFVPQDVTGDTAADEVSPLAGTAYVFKAGCTPAGYAVSGAMHARVELHGDAPVRGADCRVTGYRSDELIFD